MPVIPSSFPDIPYVFACSLILSNSCVYNIRCSLNCTTVEAILEWYFFSRFWLSHVKLDLKSECNDIHIQHRFQLFYYVKKSVVSLSINCMPYFAALRDVINLPALHVVVNMVGQKWYRLGLKLGIPDFQLDHIDHACLNLPDKALVTLNKWYELAPWQATRDYLADSLEYVERKDIADAIRDKKWR